MSKQSRKALIASLPNSILDHLCAEINPMHNVSSENRNNTYMRKKAVEARTTLYESLDSDIPYGWKTQILSDLISREIQERCAKHLL